jgi:hypothetical protein
MRGTKAGGVGAAGGNRAKPEHAMAQLVPRPRHSLDRWLRRLDRASGNINPFLTVLAIGLAILNLTCIALLAPRLPITRDTLGQGRSAACLPSPVSDPGPAPPPTGDMRAWVY